MRFIPPLIGVLGVTVIGKSNGKNFEMAHVNTYAPIVVMKKKDRKKKQNNRQSPPLALVTSQGYLLSR